MASIGPSIYQTPPSYYFLKNHFKKVVARDFFFFISFLGTSVVLDERNYRIGGLTALLAWTLRYSLFGWTDDR